MRLAQNSSEDSFSRKARRPKRVFLRLSQCSDSPHFPFKAIAVSSAFAPQRVDLCHGFIKIEFQLQVFSSSLVRSSHMASRGQQRGQTRARTALTQDSVVQYRLSKEKLEEWLATTFPGQTDFKVEVRRKGGAKFGSLHPNGWLTFPQLVGDYFNFRVPRKLTKVTIINFI